jgi:Leucine-rich repeat (LRR) protein
VGNENLKKLTNLQQLTALDLSDTSVNEVTLETFAHIQFKSLDLRSTKFTHLKMIEKQSSLQSLEMKYNALEDIAFERIATLWKTLRELNLSCTMVNIFGLKQIGLLINLELLKLTSCLNAENVLVETLCELKKLRVLYLENSFLSSATMTSVAHMTDLEELHVKNRYLCTTLQADGIEKITHLTKLVILDVSYNNIMDAGATKLIALTNLRQLSLRGTNITDISIIAIATTAMNFLERLELESNHISNGIIGNLQQLQALNHISLGATDILARDVKENFVITKDYRNNSFDIKPKIIH